MTDLEEAQAILDARVAEMNAKWNGRNGPPMAYFDLVGGGRAIYVVYTPNGIKESGREYGSLAPTAADAAKGLVATTKRLLDGSIGTLYWRRSPNVEFQSAIGFDEAERWSPGSSMSPAGWSASMRLVIANGEWETEPADLHTMPEDYPGWADMVAEYKAGLPKAA